MKDNEINSIGLVWAYSHLDTMTLNYTHMGIITTFKIFIAKTTHGASSGHTLTLMGITLFVESSYKI